MRLFLHTFFPVLTSMIFLFVTHPAAVQAHSRQLSGDEQVRQVAEDNSKRQTLDVGPTVRAAGPALLPKPTPHPEPHPKPGPGPLPGIGHVLLGLVLDAESGKSVAFAGVWIDELERGSACNDRGQFEFPHLPHGKLTLRVTRIGYASASFEIEILEQDTTVVLLPISAAGVRTNELVVVGNRDANVDQVNTIMRLEGSKLRNRLGETIAATLRNEPGIAERSMGPAPARPVIRGLGGDRLMMLEDGNTTGDLSSSSADHAVAIEPLTAQRIEVIRGPRALMFASQSIGGVVNVHRDKIPLTTPAQFGGELTLQGETVSAGGATSLSVSGPLGPLALRAELGLRSANDVGTPQGDLINTDILTTVGSIGSAYNSEWGSLGAAVSLYESEYGIPPDPVAGHPNGVRIELERYSLSGRADWQLRSEGVHSIRANYALHSYEHRELESSGSLATLFSKDELRLDLRAHIMDGELFRDGIFGLNFERRSLGYGGLLSTVDADEVSAALMAMQALHFESLLLRASIRTDFRTIQPRVEEFSRSVGEIRTRNFFGVAAAFEARYDLGSGLGVHVGVNSSIRPPTTDELFSEGPHLASYSFEVGNADLALERGLGLEAGLSYIDSDFELRGTIFRNSFQDYIFPLNTGELSRRRGDLFVFQFTGADATMFGVEVQAALRLGAHWLLEASLSTVEGRLSNDEFLPEMPPAVLNTSVAYTRGDWEAGSRLTLNAAQNNTAQFEEATAGFAVLDAYARYNLTYAGMLHSLSLNVTNILDREYRRHLNRVRHVMPEPGRSLRLLYRLYL